MGKQGRGRRLTDKERMEIIALTRQNPRIKHVELAAKYNVNESTIRKWRAQSNATKIEERYAQGVAASRDARQRGQAVRNAQFDAELYEWMTGMLKQESDLAPARVREKARAMAALHDGMEGFKASSGWYYRFCRRYGLPCGQAGREMAAKVQDDMAIVGILPMDASVQTPDPMAPREGGVHAPPSEPSSPSADQESADEEMTAASEAAAVAMSLQPPPPTAPNALEDKAPPNPESGLPSAASDLLLGLGEMAGITASTTDGIQASNEASARSNSALSLSTGALTPATAEPATVTPAVAPTATVDASALASATAANGGTAPMLSIFSPSQAAVSHMVHHFKDVLDPQTRLRLVRHLTRVPGEAEMYLVMDEETQLEYVKEFGANANATAAAAVAAVAAAPLDTETARTV